MKTDWQNVHSKVQEKRKKVTFNTMQIIAFGFLGVIFLGSILLYLPISNQEPIAYLDALFVSVSAVCVTGLVTVFPAAQFTLFGKVVLLGLIQIGGLGVIACTMAVFLAIRKKITMKSRVMIQQTYNLETLSGMVRFIIRILKGTVLVEGIGAVLFAFHFVPEYGFIKGVAYGIFHSVSAFCNAGIDVLGTSSFMEYVSSPLVSLTTMFLIVAGGLGFTVWHDVRMNLQDVAGQKRPLKRLFTRLHLQSKMVIVMTAGLIMIGTLGYFLLEYHNDATIGKLGFGEKLLASGFQSVTTRTAGFATVSQAELTSASKLFGCILMFIGGSPGGTAGGIKTTTMAILLLDVYKRQLDELARMGAVIKVEGNSATIEGVEKFSGARVSAPDLRAGAALCIAGLATDGITIVDDIVYIQRGYERFEEKLRGLGGIIEKVSDEKEIQKFKLKVG